MSRITLPLVILLSSLGSLTAYSLISSNWLTWWVAGVYWFTRLEILFKTGALLLYGYFAWRFAARRINNL